MTLFSEVLAKTLNSQLQTKSMHLYKLNVSAWVFAIETREAREKLEFITVLDFQMGIPCSMQMCGDRPLLLLCVTVCCLAAVYIRLSAVLYQLQYIVVAF